MRVSLASLPPAFAVSALLPSLRPVTSPTQPPVGADLKAAETSLPPTDTIGADVAPVMRTSASPPVTSSGRDDSTSMLRVCASALDPANAAPKNPPATTTDAFKIALFTSRPPRFPFIGWHKNKSQPV